MFRFGASHARNDEGTNAKKSLFGRPMTPPPPAAAASTTTTTAAATTNPPPPNQQLSSSSSTTAALTANSAHNGFSPRPLPAVPSQQPHYAKPPYNVAAVAPQQLMEDFIVLRINTSTTFSNDCPLPSAFQLSAECSELLNSPDRRHYFDFEYERNMLKEFRSKLQSSTAASASSSFSSSSSSSSSTEIPAGYTQSSAASSSSSSAMATDDLIPDEQFVTSLLQIPLIDVTPSPPIVDNSPRHNQQQQQQQQQQHLQHDRSKSDTTNDSVKTSPRSDVKGKCHNTTNSMGSSSTIPFNDSTSSSSSSSNSNNNNSNSVPSSMMQISPRDQLPFSQMMTHVSIPSFSTVVEQTTYFSIVGRGFKPEYAHFAVDAYQGHPEKSLDFVTKLDQLFGMGGFREIDIKEALLVTDRDLMMALDYLVALDSEMPQPQ